MDTIDIWIILLHGGKWVPKNDKPFISDIFDQSTEEDQEITDISFEVDDVETDIAQAIFLGWPVNFQNRQRHLCRFAPFFPFVMPFVRLYA